MNGIRDVEHTDLAHRPLVFVEDSPDDMPFDAMVIAVPQFIGGKPDDRALSGVIGILDQKGRPT